MDGMKGLDVCNGVHKAINAVQAELAKTGIGKDRKNQTQGYNFRGIDDMYNELSPLLAENRLVVLPKYSDRQVVERESQKGGALFYVTLKGEFTLLASDGSYVQVTTYGEAMDSGDKATNKAMSAALKYAFMQVFTIPTVGDNDSENQTHEVKGRIPATVGAWESQPLDMQNFLRDLADRASKLILIGDVAGAYDEIEGQEWQDEMAKVALWTLLDSKQRSALKAEGAKRGNGKGR